MKAWININRECNMECDWCYNKGNTVPGAMPTISYKQCLQFLSTFNLEEIVIIGGEPTIHGDFFNVLELTKQRKIKYTLVTNSIAFADELFANRFHQYSDGAHIVISLKGYSRDNCLNITKKDIYYDALRSIREIHDRGYNHILTLTIPLDVDIASDDFEAFLNDIVSEKIIITLVRPTAISPKALKDVNTEFLSNTLDRLCSMLSVAQVSYVFCIRMPFCYLRQEFVDRLISLGKLISGCQLKRGGNLFITPQLSVIPCNQLWKYELGTIGIDFSNSNEYIEYIKTHGFDVTLGRLAKCPDAKCVVCKYWKMCGGGCIYHWLDLG